MLKLSGLDTDTEERELENMERWSMLVGSIDEMRTKTERPPLGKEWAGEFPLNQIFSSLLDKYFTVGQIKEHFFGHKGAAQDPRWDYANNPFYFQQVMLLQQQQMAEQQQQIAQEQLKQQKQEEGKSSKGSKEGEKKDEVGQGVDDMLGLMQKNETEIKAARKQLKARHSAIVDNIMEEWHKESKQFLAEAADAIQKGNK